MTVAAIYKLQGGEFFYSLFGFDLSKLQEQEEYCILRAQVVVATKSQKNLWHIILNTNTNTNTRRPIIDT